MDLQLIKDRLNDITGASVREDVVLAPYTSYKIGGPSDLFVEPGSSEAVGAALRTIAEEDVPLFVLGGGCNLLISDSGWRGVTLCLGDNLTGWTLKDTDVEAKAGTVLLDFIHAMNRNGLGGMENMAGIPGRIGGALRMNAGAFGQEIKETAVEVEGFSLNGQPFRLNAESIGFDYRKAPGLDDKVITNAKFRFTEDEPEILKKKTEETLQKRDEKQPLEYPSCGSVFKRPPGQYAGELIERAGLKGTRIGGAMVSEKHAGFIVNENNASADDVYQMINMIKSKIYDLFNVELECEVKMVGDFGEV